MKVPATSSIPGTVEAKFAKRLAGNEKKIRDRAFKQLKLYMIAKSEKTEGNFSRDELMRLWKGLFYCMWMSDKPLVQEELANNMAEILPKLKNTKASMLYFETFLATMAREWRGIDRLRMDKFYLLTRFMLSQAFECLKRNLWDKGLVDWMLSILKNGPLSPLAPTPGGNSGSPLGLRLHFMDIYIEELTACGHDCLTTSQVTRFLLPYCLLLCNTPVRNLRSQVGIRIFQEIIDHSDVVLQAVAAQMDDDDEAVPEIVLKYDFAEVADSLFGLINQEGAYARNRQIVYKVIRKLREVAEGRLPLDDVPDIPEDLDNEKSDMNIAEDRLASKLAKEMAREYRERQQSRRSFRKKSKKLTNGSSQDASMKFDGEDSEEPLADFNQEEFNEKTEEEVLIAEENFVAKKSKKKKKAKKTTSGSMAKSVLIGSALAKEIDDCPVQSNRGSELDTTMQELLDTKKTDKTAKTSKIDVSKMMLDLVDKPNSNFEENSTQKKVIISKKRKIGSSINSDLEKNSIEPKQKSVKVSVTEFDETVCSPKKSVRKTKRQKVHNLLMQKLLTPDDNFSSNSSEQTCEKTDVVVISKNLKSKKKIVKSSTPAVEKQKKESPPKEEDIARFTTSAPPKAAFVRVAASKLNKPVTKTPTNTPKREPRETRSASAKRVSFQMSKIQVQPFKKNDRSSVLSPSPLTVPFDPSKTPDFGLLKQKRVMEQKSKSVPKRKRPRAADFFE